MSPEPAHRTFDRWSPALERRYYDYSAMLVDASRRTGVPLTDADPRYEDPEAREYMPHLRALTGLLLHLERSVGETGPAGGDILAYFERVLSKAGITSILDAG